MNQIPSMLQYVLSQQGRGQPSEEELALLAASRGEQPTMTAAVGPQDDKRSLLQRLFSGGQVPAQQPQPGARPVDELVAPGSVGDKLRQRRLEQERMMKDQSLLQPEDMMMAQGPDAYGGVSVQTRAAMDRLGKDVGGDMSDMVVGGQAPAVGGTPAQQSVRGKQTPKQEQQLIDMLKARGMSEKEARARARAVL